MGAGHRLSVVATAVVAISLLPWLVLPAGAQTVDLTTPFPGVTVEAGGTTSLDVEVHSTERQEVDLSVASAPEGWEATLRGGGFEVTSVTAGPDEPASVDLQLRVPAQASGTNEVVLAADGAAGGSDQLGFSLTVTESVQGAVAFETEFPTLRGGSEDTFTYDLTLRNDTGDEIGFALAAQAPEGWQVTAQPSAEQRASTITVAAGSTGSVRVEATPPADVEAGEHPIVVEASGAGQTARAELTAAVTGNFSVQLTTPSERLNASAVAGEATAVALSLVNDGTAPLTGVELSASPPSDWDVTFEPATIPELPPGETREVTAVVTPADNAIVGDYIVTMTSNATEGRSASADIRFTVETSTAWGAVGVIVILAAIGGLLWVFRRYGRR